MSEERRKWLVLVTMTGALSMILIDQTVVSVALPTIQRDLGMSQTELQWIVNAYLLTIAALVAVGGRLGDLFGETLVFRAGAIVFLVGSALCGLAQEDWWIIAARVLQGVGAAAMIPSSQAIVVNTFDVSERGRAMGIYAGISMVFLALGPLVGGVLTEDVSWRAVFYVNLPVGLAMLIAAHFTLRKRAGDPNATMDWLGLALLVPGLTLVVLGLMEGQEWGWGSAKTIGVLVGGAVCLVAFVLVEPRRRQALIELRLFNSRNFSADSAVLAFIQFSLTGLTVFGAIWVQNVLDFSPITAGLSLLPVTIPLLIGAPLAGRFYDKVGPRAIVTIGAALVAAGLIFNASVLDQRDYWWLVPGYLMLGIGIALAMTPANTDAMNAAVPKLRGQASGVIQTVRQVGATFGLAIMGTVVASVQQSKIDAFVASDPDATPGEAAEIEQVLSAGDSAQAAAQGQISPNVLDAATDAMTSGVSTAYYVAGGVMVVSALIAVVFLRRVRAADAGAEPVVVAG
jgi:EmrB/QacA subfamily drug resistance transporter